MEIPERFTIVSITPDGKTAIVTSGKGMFSVFTWSLSGHEVLKKLADNQSVILNCIFTRDSQFIACSLSYGGVYMFHVPTGMKCGRLADYSSALAFTPDGTALAVKKANSKEVDIVDLRTSNLLRQVESTHNVRELMFISATQFVFKERQGDWGREWWFLEKDGTRVGLTEGHFNCESVAVSPDAKHLAFGDVFGKVGLINLETTTLGRIREFSHYIHCTKFSPDSRIVAFWANSGNVTLVSVKYRNVVGVVKPDSGLVPWGLSSKNNELTLMTSPTTISCYNLENTTGTRILTVLAAPPETSAFTNLVQKSGDGAVLERVRKWMDVLG